MTQSASPIPSLLRASLLRWPVAAAVCAGLALGTAEAQAQATAAPALPGAEIQALGYAPIPAGAAFELQANDDNELTQDAVTRVKDALANHGYAAHDGAPLVMQIETNLIRGEKQDDPFGQVHADSEEAAVRARLFSTSQNSLLNPQQTIASAERTYRINISVYDRQSGLYVWRGTATRNDPNLEVTQASTEMITGLIGAVGQTVQPAPPAE
jgi:hypothetical protein